MNTIDCKTCRAEFPDLLSDASRGLEPATEGHFRGCAECRAEFAELRATYALLDEWTAPEPSPYFDARVRAHLREAQQAAPEGLWERLMATLRFSTGRGLRPALAGVFLFVLLLGGGTVATFWPHQATEFPANASPTVNDLRIFDNNAQALQQMDLLDESGSDSSNAAPQS